MLLQGNVIKSGKFWAVELPILDVYTQGKTRKDALRMSVDAIALLLEDELGQAVKFKVHDPKGEFFALEPNADAPVLALVLRRQRIKHDLTLAQVARRMGTKSTNAYAQYEQGKRSPGFNKFNALLAAINHENRLVLNLV